MADRYHGTPNFECCGGWGSRLPSQTHCCIQSCRRVALTSRGGTKRISQSSRLAGNCSGRERGLHFGFRAVDMARQTGDQQVRVRPVSARHGTLVLAWRNIREERLPCNAQSKPSITFRGMKPKSCSTNEISLHSTRVLHPAGWVRHQALLSVPI